MDRNDSEFTSFLLFMLSFLQCEVRHVHGKEILWCAYVHVSVELQQIGVCDKTLVLVRSPFRQSGRALILFCRSLWLEIDQK